MEVLEMMLHSKKLSYERLNKIIPQYIPRQCKEYDTVNIIIDLYDVVKQLYKPTILEQIYHMKEYERWQICSEIINMCGHYRHYFASRLWKYTNVYYIFSTEKSDYHLSIDENYKKDFYDKRLNFDNQVYGIFSNVIQENFKLIKQFLEYVPHTYVIDSKKVEHTLVPYILFKENIIDSNIPTILISNENIYYQDFAFNNNLMQLIIKGDNSRIVTRENIWEEIIRESKAKNKPEVRFINELYPILLSITGYKNFSIDKISNKGIIKGIKFMNDLLDENILSNINYSSELLEMIWNEQKTGIKKQDIIRNYNLLSHYAMENHAYNSNDVFDIKEQCVIERIDSKSLRYINEQYFGNFPIIIEYLFEGEEYG